MDFTAIDAKVRELTKLCDESDVTYDLWFRKNRSDDFRNFRKENW